MVSKDKTTQNGSILFDGIHPTAIPPAAVHRYLLLGFSDQATPTRLLRHLEEPKATFDIRPTNTD